jgi:hypothetical protein
MRLIDKQKSRNNQSKKISGCQKGNRLGIKMVAKRSCVSFLSDNVRESVNCLFKRIDSKLTSFEII